MTNLTAYVWVNGVQVGRTLANRDSGQLVAVHGVTTSWTAATPYEHPDAGTHTLTLESANPDAVHLGDVIQVNLNASATTPEAGATVGLIDGWVQSATRTRSRKTGRWTFQVSVIDVYGIAASLKLAATPWPTQTRTARLAAINAASPLPELVSVENGDPPPSDLVTVVARDVDNADALDVIRRTCSPARAVNTMRRVLVPTPFPGATLDQTGTQTVADVPPVATVPASAVEEVPGHLTRDSYLTDLAYTTQVRNTDGSIGDDQTTYVRKDPAAITRTAWAVASDRGLTPGGQVPAELLAVLNSTTGPAWAMGSVRIETDQLDAASLLALVGTQTRHIVFLRVLDHPDGPRWFVTSAGSVTLTMGPRVQLDLSLTLHDAAATLAVSPWRWDDYPPTTRFTPAGTVRFDDLEAVHH